MNYGLYDTLDVNEDVRSYYDDVLSDDEDLDEEDMDETQSNDNDHLVTFQLPAHGDIYNEIKKKTNKGADYLEMCKEIAIMKEVKNAKGNNIKERIDNTIKSWNDEKKLVNKKVVVNENKVNKYKLKYKY